MIFILTSCKEESLTNEYYIEKYNDIIISENEEMKEFYENKKRLSKPKKKKKMKKRNNYFTTDYINRWFFNSV